MANGILDPYDQSGGIFPASSQVMPGSGYLNNLTANPLVLLGLGLASGKTPQEGFAGGMRGLLAANQLGQQRQAQQSAYQAAVAAGANPQQAMALAMNPEAFKALQPQFHTLTGLLGEQTPVFVGPFGKIAGAGGQGAQGAGGIATNGPALEPNYDETGKDPAFLEAVKQQYGPVVSEDIKGITEGRMPVMGRNLQKLIPLAQRYDQNFTGAQDYQTRLQTAKSFAAGGKDATNVMSYNRALIHAQTAWDLIPKIEGVNVGGAAGSAINYPYGQYRAATDPVFANNRKQYENIINGLSGELMKASRSTGVGSEKEIAAWKEGALSANSGAEMRGALQGAVKFLDGAMAATNQNREQGFKSQFNKEDLLMPQTKQTFQNIYGYQEGGSPQGAIGPGQPVRVNTPEEARKLPKGTPIILPDGRMGKVP